MNMRNTNTIKIDKQLSKFNYGSRQNYSIEEALLEKKLIYNSTMRLDSVTAHAIIDLKVYYNRQLSNLSVPSGMEERKIK